MIRTGDHANRGSSVESFVVISVSRVGIITVSLVRDRFIGRSIERFVRPDERRVFILKIHGEHIDGRFP